MSDHHDHEHDHAYMHEHGIAHSHGHGHVHENQKAVINRELLQHSLNQSQYLHQHQSL